MGLTQSDCFAIQFCMELHSGKKCIVIEKKMQLLRANWNSFLLKVVRDTSAGLHWHFQWWNSFFFKGGPRHFRWSPLAFSTVKFLLLQKFIVKTFWLKKKRTITCYSGTENWNQNCDSTSLTEQMFSVWIVWKHPCFRSKELINWRCYLNLPHPFHQISSLQTSKRNLHTNENYLPKLRFKVVWTVFPSKLILLI